MESSGALEPIDIEKLEKTFKYHEMQHKKTSDMIAAHISCLERLERENNVNLIKERCAMFRIIDKARHVRAQKIYRVHDYESDLTWFIQINENHVGNWSDLVTELMNPKALEAKGVVYQHELFEFVYTEWSAEKELGKKRDVLPDGTIPLTEDELEYFKNTGGVTNPTFEKFMVKDNRILLKFSGSADGILTDYSWMSWILERFNLIGESDNGKIQEEACGDTGC